jgi:hypothetical protein
MEDGTPRYALHALAMGNARVQAVIQCSAHHLAQTLHNNAHATVLATDDVPGVLANFAVQTGRATANAVACRASCHLGDVHVPGHASAAVCCSGAPAASA